MADPTVRGRFVWHELLTSDPGAAQQFYATICGWRIEQWDKDSNYSMFVGPNAPVGGALQLPDNAMGTGDQPKWLAYIAADDVDATVDKAVALGARVLQQSGATPGGGRYAVLADPQGASFGLYGSTNAAPPPAQGVARGEFSWHELATSDYEAALEFYTKLFGWELLVKHDMGDMGPYCIFGLDGTQMGGIFNRSADMPGDPSWLSYVLVPNAGKSADKIRTTGGQVVNGPMEVPGGDWIAVASDPQGALFAVHAYKAKAKVRAAAAASAPEETAPPREEVAEPQAAQPAAKPVKKKAAAVTKRKSAAVKAKAPAKKTSAKKAAKKVAKKAAKKAVRKAAKKQSSKKKVVRSAARGKKSVRRVAAKKTARRGKKAARKGKTAKKKARRGK
ncbi:MAG: VOC family protein [Steroidobacteraceae bacterium]